jgi:DNA helicase-2/ATP-dependent DNA helicase PcrA
MNADDLLNALDPEQREVALALRGPVRVLAGAGTGKTRAITHRIAYGVATGLYNPTEVLAVTFTTRAAGEMRGRLRSMGAGSVQARTFHSAALRQVRYFWPRVYGGEPPRLTESKIPIIAGAARRNRVEVNQALLRDLASEIEWAKVSNVRPDDYERLASSRGREVSGLDAATVGHVFDSYEELKRDQGRMDMEDVLLCAAALLAEDERVAAEVRRQYKWFVVDEFQDVSPIQSALLDLWLGGRDEICVVGDPAQTIYSFAGARADYLADFPARFPGTTSVELVRNYRSTPQVVEAANALLSGSATTSVQLRAQRPSGAPLTWREAGDEVAEADAVAAEVGRLRQQGVPLREMAVLFRINAQSEAFEEALTARGIPYVVRGAARFFERQEVRQALALMRGEARSGDASAEQLADQVAAVLTGMGWSAEAPTARGQARDRWESLQALVSQAVDHSASEAAAGRDASLAGFVAELDRRAHEQHAPVAEGVTLATLHAAKGLEWDAVFLCGMQEGSMPITYADTPAAVEEERRLLYVGMTRARVHLWISWALARNPGGQARRRPSRFLAGLRPASSTDRAEEAGPRPRRQGKRAAACKQCQRPLTGSRERNRGYCQDCPVPYDEDLFELLRSWRKEQAEAQSVPAFVVFSDATLEALAEVKPRDRRALQSINGIGKAKLDKYAEELLDLIG